MGLDQCLRVGRHDLVVGRIAGCVPSMFPSDLTCSRSRGTLAAVSSSRTRGDEGACGLVSRPGVVLVSSGVLPGCLGCCTLLQYRLTRGATGRAGAGVPLRAGTVLPVDAEVFVERGPKEPVGSLLSANERYTGRYYLAAYVRKYSGYRIGVVPIPDQTLRDAISHHLVVEDLKRRGYGLRGMKSDHETLDQDIATWLEGPCKWPIHDFIMMVAVNGQEIEIDEAIVSLIGALWSHGVRTDSSCQGGNATLYGVQPGYVVYNVEDHQTVIKVIEETGLTGVEFVPGPSANPNLRAVEFDPVP
jgi:hypothetical protein